MFHGMARRHVSPPPELAEAHANFKAAIRAAYGAFMQVRRERGFCCNGSCMDRAEPERTLCKYHAAYQLRWQRRHAQDMAQLRADLRAQRTRVMCEAHGNYADICGCTDVDAQPQGVLMLEDIAELEAMGIFMTPPVGEEEVPPDDPATTEPATP
jgi:hypothetical protein